MHMGLILKGHIMMGDFFKHNLWITIISMFIRHLWQ